MFDIILLALVLTALAGLWDLRTTEVPDELLAIMVISGISYWLISASITGGFYPLFVSLAIGTVLLALGLMLYKKGQWGGADAWILAAVGYMIPLYGGALFIVPYIMNFFIVSAIYMIAYSVALGMKNPYVFRIFAGDMKKNRRVLLIPFVFLAFFLFLNHVTASLGYAARAFPVVEMFVLLLFLTAFWRYGRAIERHVFRKRIPASRLRAGDVLEDMNWVGLTQRQVAVMKSKRKYVTIKEGVRFVPVFFFSLVVTLLWGNVLFMVLGI